MALQRTRRPRLRSGHSLCSLGSPLNARLLGFRGTVHAFMNAKRIKGFLVRVPPPVFFFTCLLVGWGLGRARPASVGLDALSIRLPIALSLFALASILGMGALVVFSRRRTSPMPFGTPTALLTSGPFRLSRNPLYVALVIVLSGFGVLLDSVWVLAAVPLLALALNTFIIPGEEARLREVFGEQYLAYCSRVRRWL